MSLHLLTIQRQHLKVDRVIMGYGGDFKLTNCKAHKENQSLSWQRISCLWTKEDVSATEEKRISRDERECTAHDKERVHSQKRWITSYGPSLPFTNIVKGSTSHRLLLDHYPAMNFTDQVVLYMLCLVVGRMDFSTLLLLSSFIERYTITGLQFRDNVKHNFHYFTRNYDELKRHTMYYVSVSKYASVLPISRTDLLEKTHLVELILNLCSHRTLCLLYLIPPRPDTEIPDHLRLSWSGIYNCIHFGDSDCYIKQEHF